MKIDTNKISDIVSKLYDYDPDGKWIVQEKLEPIRELRFKTLTGLDFNNLCLWLKWGFKVGDKISEYQNLI